MGTQPRSHLLLLVGTSGGQPNPAGLNYPNSRDGSGLFPYTAAAGDVSTETSGERTSTSVATTATAENAPITQKPS